MSLNVINLCLALRHLILELFKAFLDGRQCLLVGPDLIVSLGGQVSEDALHTLGNVPTRHLLLRWQRLHELVREIALREELVAAQAYIPSKVIVVFLFMDRLRTI